VRADVRYLADRPRVHPHRNRGPLALKDTFACRGAATAAALARTVPPGGPENSAVRRRDPGWPRRITDPSPCVTAGGRGEGGPTRPRKAESCGSVSCWRRECYSTAPHSCR